MSMSSRIKTALSQLWTALRHAALELNRALAEPQHLESDPLGWDRDESVFQPRKY